jgi:hypothetical protein
VPGKSEVCGNHVFTPPLMCRDAGISLVEPSRRQIAQLFVQGEVRQLMSQRFQRIAGVARCGRALDDNAVRLRKGDRRSPFWRSGPDPFTKPTAIRRDGDHDMRTWFRQSGKRIVGSGATENRLRESPIPWIEQHRHPTAVEALSIIRLLCVNAREAAGKQREYDEERNPDQGSPPSATICRTSAHFFPHGLNLLASTPRFHAPVASSC